MNPYGPPHSYSQQSAGPPQPPWQAPPRKGWGDPRLSQDLHSPTSPGYQTSANAFGPPLPPVHPSLGQAPSIPQPPPSFDTKQWGVRYNQGLQGMQSDAHEPKPALPPRPTADGAGRISPAPDHTALANQSQYGAPSGYPGPQQHQQQHQQHQPAPWNDPYNSAVLSQSSYPPPPPPPPRPAAYQAQIDQFNRTSTPHQDYSHQPPSHHYDPPQGAWGGPAPSAPTNYPSAPPPHQVANAKNDELVSPIEHSGGYWGQPGQSHGASAANNFNTAAKPESKPTSSQALGPFGGPSDWEHYDPSGPPNELSPATPEGRPSSRPGIHSQAIASPPAEPRYQTPAQGPPPPEEQGYQNQGYGHPSMDPRYSSVPPVEQRYQTPGPAQQLNDSSYVQAGQGPQQYPQSGWQNQGPVSPPIAPATLATSQAPKPGPERMASSRPAEVMATPPADLRKASPKQQPPPPTAVVERPSPPDRHDTVSTVRTDSYTDPGIDSVIQAWNSPLKPRSDKEFHDRPGSSSSAQLATPAASPGVKILDPYEDLEPEFKASLKRYAAMLRKEAAADSDEEKFSIFQAFANKELRLRSLMYGVELTKDTKGIQRAASVAHIQHAPSDRTPQPQAPAVERETSIATTPKPPVQDTVQAPIVATIESKPAPAPVNITPSQAPRSEPAKATGQFNPPAPNAPISLPPVSLPPVSHPLVSNPSTANPPKPPTVETRPRSRDESFVMVNKGGVLDDAEYSPGGRPRVKPAAQKMADDGEFSPGGRPRVGRPNQPGAAERPFIDTLPPRIPQPPAPDMATSPGINAPMVIDDYVMAQPPSPSVNAPILVVSETPKQSSGKSPNPGRSPQVNKPVTPIKFEPPRPAYTPFKYNAAAVEEKPKLDKPADVAYSSLRHSVADSGRLMAQENLLAPARPTSASGRKEHEEAFIGLIRKQSMAVRQKTPAPSVARPGTTPPLSMRVGTPFNAPPDNLAKAVSEMRALLPRGLPSPISQHPKLKSVQSKLDNYPDQFAFIHDSVVEWDKTNREVKKLQDAERHQRQEDNEARIDELFNDNEIGYNDIGDLEAEFKLAEAERKYRENQEELDSFTKQVFTVVTERLQKEIADLTTAYTMAVDVLDLESEPVSRCYKAVDKARMSESMNCVLGLFNKMEVRHKKVAEAHLERERRRKHLELTVLYTNGDTAAVKKLEAEFAVAEKMQILHEARAKDTRANKLMDTFDRATVRGLGDNQMFVDDISAKLQDLRKAALAVDPSSKSKLYEPDGARDTLAAAKDVLETVMGDSRRMLALSNEADVLLNDSDYGVSVAEAKVANADTGTYGKLETEKIKEDAKLVEEMNTRIRSVTKGPQDALNVVREITEHIGDDPNHQERMKKALEAAKQRNASIDAGGAA